MFHLPNPYLLINMKRRRSISVMFCAFMMFLMVSVVCSLSALIASIRFLSLQCLYILVGFCSSRSFSVSWRPIPFWLQIPQYPSIHQQNYHHHGSLFAPVRQSYRVRYGPLTPHWGRYRQAMLYQHHYQQIVQHHGHWRLAVR